MWASIKRESAVETIPGPIADNDSAATVECAEDDFAWLMFGDRLAALWIDDFDQREFRARVIARWFGSLGRRAPPLHSPARGRWPHS